MLKSQQATKWIVVTIVALMAGFAPLFHSLCISAAQITSVSNHIMADGTPMGMHAKAAAETAYSSPFYAHVVSKGHVPVNGQKMPEGRDPISLVVLFIAPACLLLAGFLLLIRKAGELKISATCFTELLARPPTWRYRHMALSPLALGISRT